MDGRYLTGLAFKGGKGVEQDLASAKWMRLMTDQRSTGAQLELGLAYSSGAGIEKNDAWRMIGSFSRQRVETKLRRTG